MGEGDFKKAEVVIKESIEKCLEYYDGNENNDIIVDPYLFLASIQM